jgi:arylsulfatase A-like enzyme
MATGMMPNGLGAIDNETGSDIKNLPSEVNEHSMGKIVARAGYDSFYGGKVHMCESLRPEITGYGEYFEDERDKLPAACLDFIKRKRDKPFFALASFINPHDICFAHRAKNGIDTEGVLELYEQAAALPLDSLPPLPANHRIPHNEPSAVGSHASTTAITPSGTMRKEYDERSWRIYRWIYNRLTEQVDRHIGIILDSLEDAGLEENTLIIFLSDHGNMDASHHLSSKGFYYEESVGVPLILSCKGSIAPGQVDQEHLVSTGLDLLPTICDYAGIEKPAHLTGASLRPIAEGRSVLPWRSCIAAENDWFRMIRSRSYKYCAFTDADSKELLVDLEHDPGEMKNLVDEPGYQAILDEYRSRMAEWK